MSDSSNKSGNNNPNNNPASTPLGEVPTISTKLLPAQY